MNCCIIMNKTSVLIFKIRVKILHAWVFKEGDGRRGRVKEKRGCRPSKGPEDINMFETADIQYIYIFLIGCYN